MAIAMKSWDAERQRVRAWIATAEEATAELKSEVLAAIENLQKSSEKQASQLNAVVSGVETGINEIKDAPKPKGAVFYVLQLKSSVDAAIEQIKRQNSHQAESLCSILKQQAQTIALMKTVFEEMAMEKKAAPVEFEVTERDDRNRVKKFRVVEKS